MKNSISFYTLLFIILTVASCRQSRYITERHIKNNIDKHEVGKQSNIRTYNIFRGNTISTGRYLELTGYKLNNEKGLVIGADRSYVTRKISSRNGNVVESISLIDYIHLDLDQTRSILSNYARLLEKLKKEKPLMNEEVYHDYTVSKDCFMSFRKTSTSNGVDFINIWVNGEKYQLRTAVFINRLKKFVEY